jgi:hypothetical protein
MKIMASDMVLRTRFYKYSNNAAIIDKFYAEWMTFNKQIPIINGSLNATILNAYDDYDSILHTLYEIYLFNIDIMINSVAAIIYQLASLSNPLLDDPIYLDAVVHESARLNPGIAITFSERVVNTKFMFESGDIVSIDAHKLNRDPEIWDNPDVFRPDRFITNGQLNDLIFKYHRFGLRERKCLGMNYGDTIIKLVIRQLFSKYHFWLSDECGINKSKATIINISEFKFPRCVNYASN